MLVSGNSPEVIMIFFQSHKKATFFLYSLTFCFLLFFCLVSGQVAFAQGVFEKKEKAKHALSGDELRKLKSVHRLKFGEVKVDISYKTDNPWERKKQRSAASVNKGLWGECREYALQKRNQCYREGQNAYRCEQKYEARTKLCDNDL